ncbi:MAG: Ku protein [Acidimicrobiia bacterium]
MQSIWKGAISFGLVTIPVGLYSAPEDKKASFKQLRKGDHSPIRYRRVAETDGEEVEYSDIVRGYEIEKGKYVVFTKEELNNIGKALSGTVDVVQFVGQEEIDPIYFKKSYYLAPEKGGVKAYKILLNSLKAENKVGIAKVAIREREYVSTLRAEDDVLVLETMWWPDEVREPAFESLQEEVDPSDEELKMAAMIIDNLSATFDPTMWNDASREAVEAMAQAKVDGEEIVAPESPEPTKVVDLLDALKASVEATKAKKKAG